jgi:hypothetical protein
MCRGLVDNTSRREEELRREKKKEFKKREEKRIKEERREEERRGEEKRHSDCNSMNITHTSGTAASLRIEPTTHHTLRTTQIIIIPNMLKR